MFANIISTIFYRRFISGVVLKIILLAVLIGGSIMTTPSIAKDSNKNYNESFDTKNNGDLPAGWKYEATGNVTTPSQWHVKLDQNAPSKPNVLTIENIKNNSNSVFNLCWTNQVQFLNGVLQVRVRANQGELDQGGGLIWRVKDANNYYVARYNPLENNFRLYYVQSGRRHQIATAEGIDIKSGDWFTIRIEHKSHHIQGWINNTPAWNITDDHLLEPGGIGVWTKSDAASSFDDIRITMQSAQSQ